METLVYGSAGFIGAQIVATLRRHGHRVVCGEARLDDTVQVAAELRLFASCTHVVNAAGRTHGPEEHQGNIDYLEPSDDIDLNTRRARIDINIRDNLFAPVQLAMLCQQHGKHYTYIGTGCIYDGAHVYDRATAPNYHGSCYSIVKGYADQLMPASALVIRLRMPIADSVDEPRGFIAKVLRYKDNLASMLNSMTVVAHACDFIVTAMANDLIGKKNIVNECPISHVDIINAYNAILETDLSYTEVAQQDARTVGGRCNVTLVSDLKDYPSTLAGVKSILFNARIPEKIYTQHARYLILWHVGNVDIGYDMFPRIMEVVARYARQGVSVIINQADAWAGTVETMERFILYVTAELKRMGALHVHGIQTINRGRDTGGYLRLAEYMQEHRELQSEHMLFVHSKTESTWRNDMLDRVCGRSDECIAYLDQHLDTLMVGQRTMHNDGANLPAIIDMCKTLGWEPPLEIDADVMARIKSTRKPHIASLIYARRNTSAKKIKFDFIPGTMFWMRTDYWNKIYNSHRSNWISIEQTMELGDTHDRLQVSSAHAMERLLGLAAHQYHYKVAGLPN